jgi:hypothetical protein
LNRHFQSVGGLEKPDAALEPFVASSLLHDHLRKHHSMKPLILAFTALAVTTLHSGEVRIQTDAQGRAQLLRNGEPYLARGANWPTPETIDALVAAGGNSIRTYADEIEWMLPLAKNHRLTVMLGLRIGREREGFDYTDQTALDTQIERLRAKVRRYKDEPELLCWAIGNEPELWAKNTIPLWREVNRIARMIREEDPNHPIITVVASFDEKKIRELIAHCPDLDALGVNWYGPADQWPDDLKKFGWEKPYFHTEFGPRGYWEPSCLGFTEWGAPIEESSTQKAVLYMENWRDAILARPGQALGGYAFIWSPKQERTQTWFSMHLFGGERTELVDAMQTAWTGRPPENPAPKIIEWKSIRAVDEYQPGQAVKITMIWNCPRPANLHVEIREETSATQVGGDVEPVPRTLPHTHWTSIENGIEITAPTTPGKYRIFALITTADHTAATANLPILVNEPAKP